MYKNFPITIQKTYPPIKTGIWNDIHFEFRIRRTGDSSDEDINLHLSADAETGAVLEGIFVDGLFRKYRNATPEDSGWQKVRIRLADLGAKCLNPLTIKLYNRQHDGTEIEFWIRNLEVTRDPSAIT